MSPSLRRGLLSGALAASVSVISLGAYWLTHGSGPFWQDSGLFLAALQVGGGLLPPGYPVYLLLGRPFVAAFEMLLPGRAVRGSGEHVLGDLGLPRRGSDLSVDPHAAAAGLPVLFVGALPGRAGFQDGLVRSVARRPAHRPFVFTLVPGPDRRGLRAERLLLGRGPVPGDPAGRGRPARAGALVPAATMAILLLIAHGLSFGNHPVTVVFVPAILWLGWKARAALRDRRFLGLAVLAYAGSALLPYLYLPYAAKAFPQTPYSGVVESLGARGPGQRLAVEHRRPELWLVLRPTRGSPGSDLAGDVRDGPHRSPARSPVAPQGTARAAPLSDPGSRPRPSPSSLVPARRGIRLLAADRLHGPVRRVGGGPVRGDRRHPPSARPRGLAAVCLLALAALTLAPPLLVNRALVDRSDYFVPEDFGRNLYRHLEPGAVFIAVSDQENALTYYLDAVAHERPDVIRIDAGVVTTPVVRRPAQEPLSGLRVRGHLEGASESSHHRGVGGRADPIEPQEPRRVHDHAPSRGNPIRRSMDSGRGALEAHRRARLGGHSRLGLRVPESRCLCPAGPRSRAAEDAGWIDAPRALHRPDPPVSCAGLDEPRGLESRPRGLRPRFDGLCQSTRHRPDPRQSGHLLRSGQGAVRSGPAERGAALSGARRRAAGSAARGGDRLVSGADLRGSGRHEDSEPVLRHRPPAGPRGRGPAPSAHGGEEVAESEKGSPLEGSPEHLRSAARTALPL